MRARFKMGVSQMFRLRGEQLEILISVICLDAIDMMHRFATRQWSTDAMRNDKAMFLHIPLRTRCQHGLADLIIRRDADPNIAEFVNMTTATPRVVIGPKLAGHLRPMLSTPQHSTRLRLPLSASTAQIAENIALLPATSAYPRLRMLTHRHGRIRQGVAAIAEPITGQAYAAAFAGSQRLVHT